MEQILEGQLDQLQRRVLETAKGEFFFDVTGAAKEFFTPERLRTALWRAMADVGDW